MPRGNRRIRQLALAACALATPLPAFAAGSVYLPLPGNPVAGFDWEARVVVANRGKVNHSFNHQLLPLDSDGTKRPAAAVANAVAGGDTALLDLSNSPAGLLELSGAQQFVYSGQLVRAGDTAPIAVGLPTISTENMALAHQRLFLQGWLRVGTKATDLSIVNLGHAAAQCTLRYYRANGTEVAAAATINMAPLSHRIYKDVLKTLGADALSDVRGDVTCNQAFYAFALVRDSADGEIAIIEPSALGENGLQDVGGGSAPGVCPPDAFKCFSKPGVFFTPTKGVPFHREIFPLPEGAYTKVHYRHEVYHGGWQKPSSGLHHFLWLSINGQQYRLLGMGYALGPNNNQMLFRHGDKIISTSKPRLTPHFVAIPGKTYVVDYTYDTVGDTIDFQISEKGGPVVFRHNTERPNVNRIHVESHEIGLVADFSTHNDHPNEPTTSGWRYANAFVTVYLD